ncbi:MAG: nuclear transport factor 2 family protein [Hyphomicrobiales bacterium]|nr:nuclear transport factor 2 family protein [Hyphomicrobiales bacterium]
MTQEEAVLATLEEYADAYCTKDIDRLMALFDDGDDISLIGTGADEFCAGRSEIQAVFMRNFSDATASRFQRHWRHVTIAGDSAVVAATMTIHLDTEDGPLQVPVRWTVSLVRRSGQWRWLHRHASSAAASQEEGSAYPAVGNTSQA